MIFVDTGAWFALYVPQDVNNGQANNWLRDNHEPLLATDYVLDEVSTLLRARGYNAAAVKAGEKFFVERIGLIHYLSAREIFESWQIFRDYRDKEWSFTDCTSKVVMEKLGIETAFAFDDHFRQFGSVMVVP